MVCLPLRRRVSVSQSSPSLSLFLDGLPGAHAHQPCLDTPYGVERAILLSPVYSVPFCPLFCRPRKPQTAHISSQHSSAQRPVLAPYPLSFRLHRGHSRPFLCRLANICRLSSAPCSSHQHLFVLRGVSKPPSLGSQEEKNPSS